MNVPKFITYTLTFQPYVTQVRLLKRYLYKLYITAILCPTNRIVGIVYKLRHTHSVHKDYDSLKNLTKREETIQKS
jgi:hypothetical protein